MAKYFYLLEKVDNGGWAVAFGDYDKSVVDDEADAYHQSGFLKKNLKIISCQDNPEAAKEAIDKLNS